MEDRPDFGERKSATTKIDINIKDINNYYPVLSNDIKQVPTPPTGFYSHKSQVEMTEGSSEQTSKPVLKFDMCEAFDPDTDEFSTDINKYSITSVKCMSGGSCDETSQYLEHFKIESIASKPAGKSDPCERMVELEG